MLFIAADVWEVIGRDDTRESGRSSRVGGRGRGEVEGEAGVSVNEPTEGNLVVDEANGVASRSNGALGTSGVLMATSSETLSVEITSASLLSSVIDSGSSTNAVVLSAAGAWSSSDAMAGDSLRSSSSSASSSSSMRVCSCSFREEEAERRLLPKLSRLLAREEEGVYAKGVVELGVRVRLAEDPLAAVGHVNSSFSPSGVCQSGISTLLNPIVRPGTDFLPSSAHRACWRESPEKDSSEASVGEASPIISRDSLRDETEDWRLWWPETGREPEVGLAGDVGLDCDEAFERLSCLL